jgi:hypothetical protein
VAVGLSFAIGIALMAIAVILVGFMKVKSTSTRPSGIVDQSDCGPVMSPTLDAMMHQADLAGVVFGVGALLCAAGCVTWALVGRGATPPHVKRREAIWLATIVIPVAIGTTFLWHAWVIDYYELHSGG